MRYKIDDIAYRNAFFTFPYAKSVKLIFAGTAWSYGEHDYQSTEACVWTYIDLTVGSDGTIAVPSNVIETMA